MKLRVVCSDSPDELLADQVLGGLELGWPLSAGRWGWPVQQVAAPVLAGGCSPMHEAWLLDGPVESGRTDGIDWRRCEGLMFGVVQLPEPAVARDLRSSPLRELTEQVYRNIFGLLDAQGMPHLWRVWNYLPDIHGEQAGLERYRQFNMGRGDAFEHCARSVTEQVPAACALGVSGGPLSVAFLCGTTPLVPIENPRQVSAYRYPLDYGPRSPTFSRAALAHWGAQELFFVSGTASIVGHESVHRGDVVAQTHETLNNIETLLDEAAGRSDLGRMAMASLHFRAYVRRAADLDAVRQVLAERLGVVSIQYVQAEVCREELLVEIEAFGLRGA